MTNNTRDAEKGFIFNRDDRRNPATKGSAKRNRPYIITNRLSFVITKVCTRDYVVVERDKVCVIRFIARLSHVKPTEADT